MAEVVVHPGAGAGAASARRWSAPALAEGGDGTRIWAHGNLEPARATAESLGLRRRARAAADAPVADRPARGHGPRRRPHRHLLAVPTTTPNCCGSTTPRSPGTPNRAAGPTPTSPSAAPSRGSTPRVCSWPFDEETGELLGFHWTKVHSDGLGEVYVVGVDPAAQGRGLGRDADVGRAASPRGRLSASAQPTVMLYVEADNSAAVNTYRAAGFRGVQRATSAYATD